MQFCQMIRFVKRIKRGERIESNGVCGISQMRWAGVVFLRRWHVEEGLQIKTASATGYGAYSVLGSVWSASQAWINLHDGAGR